MLNIKFLWKSFQKDALTKKNNFIQNTWETIVTVILERIKYAAM